jgi:hypothetical protein
VNRWVSLLAIALAAPSGTLAQGSGSVSVSSDPPALVVGSAGAGNELLPAMNSSTTYSVTVLGLGLGITGQLNGPMPPNTMLRVTLAAPGGATSLGPVALSTTPQALVRALPLGTFSGLEITYEFSAFVEAGVVPATSRSVTLTITAVP